MVLHDRYAAKKDFLHWLTKIVMCQPVYSCYCYGTNLTQQPDYNH
jgi:hypothetical protein